MRVIFFDTETTGLGETDRLCQLAVKERGKAEPLVNTTYKPPIPIPHEASNIHKITNEMVSECSAFLECKEYAELKELFEESDTIAVAHNAAFDLGMLSREGIVPQKVICTRKVARMLDAEKKLREYGLQYLRQVLGISVEARAHDALGDVLVLEQLFERLLAKLTAQKGEDVALEDMIEISLQPLLFTTLRFGKHNGKKIEEVVRIDTPYLEWLLGEKKKNPEGETDWIYTLEHYLQGK